MSPEALAYRSRYEPDVAPIDFSKIEQRRAEAKSGFSDAVDRAIERHQLDVSDCVVGGIDCLRVTSRSAGTANGRMLYVFGGGFILGDPETDMPVIGALAEGCGVEIIAPRYRLAPEHSAPAAGDDCYAVFEALRSDTSTLFLAGESAGGNLALLTAQRAIRRGLESPIAMALLSPAVDLRTDRSHFGATVDADPSLSHQLVRDIASVYPGERAIDDPEISPLFGPMAGLPPTILTTGTRDLLLSMTLRLAVSMRRSGVDVRCDVWPGMWHVFEFYDDFPESAESLGAVVDFLNDSAHGSA